MGACWSRSRRAADVDLGAVAKPDAAAVCRCQRPQLPLELAAPHLLRSRDKADREDATGERVGVELLLEPEFTRHEFAERLPDEATGSCRQGLARGRNEGIEQLRHLGLQGVVAIARVPDQSEPAALPQHPPDL